jgi:hypothetical protein
MSGTQETNSLEARWFGTGAVPERLDEWIAGLGPTETATRTDLYLAPSHPTFNLKLRGGGGEFVELKRRLGGPERRGFGSGVAGHVEQWYKWSFPLAHATELRTTDRTGLWLPVEKTRTLHAFDGADRGPLDERLATADVTAHVELTAVAARSETAWTVGIEVAGRPGALEDALDAVGTAAFGDGFPVDLSPTQSVGYAAWLHRLAADSRPSADVLVPSNR